METLVVNLMGPPGAGKSTMAAGIFSELKWRGVDVELVTEFAKECVWEERHETFKNEVYIFAKQFHRLFRLKGKVRVIVTDRPIVLSLCYNQLYGNGEFDKLDDLVLEQHNSFTNYNILLNRTKKYNPSGRNQSQEESDELGSKIEAMLNFNGILFDKVDGTKENINEIVDRILNNI